MTKHLLIIMFLSCEVTSVVQRFFNCSCNMCRHIWLWNMCFMFIVHRVECVGFLVIWTTMLSSLYDRYTFFIFGWMICSHFLNSFWIKQFTPFFFKIQTLVWRVTRVFELSSCLYLTCFICWYMLYVLFQLQVFLHAH